jgi:hypothetical protein
LCDFHGALNNVRVIFFFYLHHHDVDCNFVRIARTCHGRNSGITPLGLSFGGSPDIPVKPSVENDPTLTQKVIVSDRFVRFNCTVELGAAMQKDILAASN